MVLINVPGSGDGFARRLQMLNAGDAPEYWLRPGQSHTTSSRMEDSGGEAGYCQRSQPARVPAGKG